MLKLLTPSTTSELVCLICAIICLAKDASPAWRSMILYLAITCLTEFSGRYMGIHSYNNHWLYNIFLLFDTSFIMLMFIHLYRRFTKNRLVFILGLGLFVVSYIYELIYHGFNVYYNFTITVVSVMYIIYGLYFYYLIITDDQYINLFYFPGFWWVAGLLLFNFGSITCNIFNTYLDSVKVFNNQQLSYLVFKVLNVILYSCWSYSFICRKWLTTRTTSET